MTIQRPIIWNYIFYRPCDRNWLQQPQPEICETNFSCVIGWSESQFNSTAYFFKPSWILTRKLRLLYFLTMACFFFYHVSSFLMQSGNILWQIYCNAGKTTTMFPGESTPSFLLPPSSSSPKSVIPCLSWMTYDVNSTRWISCRGALDFASGNKTTQQVYTRRSLLLCFWLLSGVSWLVSLCHWLISGLRSRK